MRLSPSQPMMDFGFDKPLGFWTHFSFNRTEPNLTNSCIDKIYSYNTKLRETTNIMIGQFRVEKDCNRLGLTDKGV